MIRLPTLIAVCCLTTASLADVRIKDVTSMQGAQELQLIGYGLVVGLQGTGDTLRNTPFTEQALQSMLNRMGVNVQGNALRNRNVAAVIVTTDLPTTIKPGSRLDVTVSALGDAPSLMGGTLIFTTLSGADGETYATAQGAVSVTGFDVAGQAENVSQGVPTAGRISNGAIVQRSMNADITSSSLILQLRNPDYNTAIRITDAINNFARKRFSLRVAAEIDSRSIQLVRPPQLTTTRFLAEIGDLTIEPDTAARVVIDARTGTVVIGQDVQISTVAVTHGTLSVRVTETPTVSQPAPRSNGKTVVAPNTQIDVSQQGGPVEILGGTSLRGLVAGLNKIGLKPTGLIAIIQTIKAAGALQADLVVQ